MRIRTHCRLGGHAYAEHGYQDKRGHNYCKICKAKNTRKSYSNQRQEVQLYKIAKGCAKCGYNRNPHALDFHHPEDNKVVNIGRDASRINKERLWNEIRKCEVLCRNCHAEEHYPAGNVKAVEEIRVLASYENEGGEDRDRSLPRSVGDTTGNQTLDGYGAYNR